MRLPEIRYDTEVQSKGRITSKAPQLIAQTGRMMAEGKREEGKILSTTEKNAGKMIANAMTQQANQLAQAELAAEKEKNDKIAQYSIQAAQFDIRSKLAGDVLKIQEERDKFIIDREYERDYNILGIQAGLKRAQFAIEAEAKKKSLDIQNQLKLDILDIQQDAAWTQTLINVGTKLVGIAAEAYVQNQNTKNENLITSAKIEYATKQKAAAAELKNAGAYVNIDDPTWSHLDIDNNRPPGMSSPVEAELPDGSTGRMVPTHEVSTFILDKLGAEHRAEAMGVTDSAAHLADLENKLNIIDGEIQIANISDTAKKEQDFNKATLESNIMEMQNQGMYQDALKEINKAEAAGIFSRSEATKFTLENKTKAIYKEYQTDIDNAVSLGRISQLRERVKGQNLDRVLTNDILGKIKAKEGMIRDSVSEAFYGDAMGGLIEQRSNPLMVLPDGQTAPTDMELRSQMVQQAKDYGFSEKEANKLGDRFAGDLKDAHASDKQAKSAIMDQAKPFIDEGVTIPDDIIKQLPEGSAPRRELEAANRKILKDGHIATDMKALGTNLEQATNLDPSVREKWARNFDPAEHVSKMDSLDLEVLTTKQKQIVTGKMDFTTAQIQGNNSNYKKRAEQVWPGTKKADPDAMAKSDAMLHRINKEILQVEKAQGEKATPDQVNAIVTEAFSENLVGMRPNTPAQIAAGKQLRPERGGVKDIGTIMGQNMPAATDLLIERGIDISNKSLLAVKNEAMREILKEGGQVTTEAINQKISYGARVAAAAEGAGYLTKMGKPINKRTLEGVFNDASKQLQRAGKPTDQKYVTAIISEAERRGVPISVIADQIIEHKKRQQ